MDSTKDRPMLQMAARSTLPSTTASPAHLARTLLEQALDVLDADPPAARRILDRVNFFLDQRQVQTPVSARPAPDAPVAPPKGGLAPWQLRRVRDYIDENLASTISIETLAATARISSSHFCRAFKTSMGETAHSYIMRCRV
jgi:AraC family transcriptional regulator